jgi:hypothetical protein
MSGFDVIGAVAHGVIIGMLILIYWRMGDGR